MTGGVTCDYFLGTSTGMGDFDPNGQTIVTAGNCDWAAAFLFDSAADCLNGCVWTVGGNWTADAQDLNATAKWDLDVTGTAVAANEGNVEYCEADGGEEIDASAGPWVIDGNTLNWNVGAVGYTIPLSYILEMAQ